jgi:acetyl-CoA carboxylase carboxyl transferase subunit alpha
VISFIDTPAAYPGIESEERGVAEAIALNLREMSQLSVPVIVVICGEGGSGGALGIAVGDRVLMQEFGVYSVIPPEGCAGDPVAGRQKKVEAAIALKITAPDLSGCRHHRRNHQGAGGGAHLDYGLASDLWMRRFQRHLGEVKSMTAGRTSGCSLSEVPRDGPARSVV